MKKSKLVKYLIDNIVQHGDGELTVEVTSSFSEEGKHYRIADLMNSSHPNGNYTAILVHTDSEFTR